MTITTRPKTSFHFDHSTTQQQQHKKASMISRVVVVVVDVDKVDFERGLQRNRKYITMAFGKLLVV